MTRSRTLEYKIVKVFRIPAVSFFKIIPKSFVRVILRMFRWSESAFGFGIRYLCVQRLSKACGKKVIIFPGCMLHWLENCSIGENVSIHDFCYIDAVGGIKIGNDTRIAHNCSIISGMHNYDVPNKTIVESGGTTAPVEIGEDVWLATGVVILQGVTVGKGSVVGANSVVTKDVKSYSVVGGIPAEFIKPRFEKTDCEENS